ncbi:CRISPR-associated RAMP family protein [Geobacillus lituanicus]|nr:CRISPR-associated RAMP family protein [Geobacillus lituanicus]
MTRKNVNGKVISWKGTYGFIQIDGSSETVFVHESEVKGKGELSRGESVVFDIVPGKKGLQAANVQVQQSSGFYNPYNFVRWSPPAKEGTELARGPAPNLLEAKGHTGTIQCRLQTVSPLFIKGNKIPEVIEGNRIPKDNEHETYEFFKSGGKHTIPGSSLRGMIRSVFEAVTNSTYQILNENDENVPLFYRGDPNKMAANLIPARIIKTEEGELAAELMTGYVSKQDIKQNRKIHYAAWVLRYKDKWLGNGSSDYHKRKVVHVPEDISHGNEVYAILSDEPIQYQRSFRFWNVLEINKDKYKLSDPSKAIKGYYYESGFNFPRKHDERFFFRADEAFLQKKGGYPFDQLIFPLSPLVQQRYDQLLENYREVNEGKNPPDGLEQSRHIRKGKSLKEGDLLYVQLNEAQTEVVALYPVMISRTQYTVSVLDLLPEHLRAPQSANELCPASRLFGWVKHKKGEEEKEEQMALRSRVKVSDGKLAKLSGTFPITFKPLGTPKPTAVPMYLRPADPNAPSTEGRYFKKGYDEGPKEVTIRGRKMYLAHSKWKRESHREGTKFNISAKDVVDLGSEFTFEITFQDLTDVELGALLWTLQLEDGMVHRLGYAKPLGYGHVKIFIEHLYMEDICSRYANWSSSSVRDEKDKISFYIQKFKEEMEKAFAKPFENIIQVADLKAILTPKRERFPIHYPKPNPEGKEFKWFVQNKAQHRKDLPDLTYHEVLPFATEDKPLSYNKTER